MPSSTSSSEDEIVWKEPKQRSDDSWLSVIESRCVGSQSRGKEAKVNERVEREKKNEEIRKARELNTFVKQGGDVEQSQFYKWILNEKKRLAEEKEDSDSEDEQPKKEEQKNSTGLSENERNAICAKIMKAELMGNHELVKQLKKQLESPDAGTKPTASTGKLKNEKKPSDESMSVKEMFKREKRSTVEDDQKLFVASSSADVDDEYDDVKKKKKQKYEHANLRYANETQNDFECRNCLRQVGRHLVLTVKNSVFVRLPPTEPLTFGHCFIQSISHSNFCTVSADEDCLREINELRTDLCSVFAELNLATVFIETYFKRKRTNHLTIECFTLKKKYESDLRMYFKKAILECENEWSMNKKLVDLNGKCVTKMIPKGMAYFWVGFGSQNIGYAHVIEDEQVFPSTFGIEILSGLLKIEPRKWKKPVIQDYNDQYKRAIEMKKHLQKLQE